MSMKWSWAASLLLSMQLVAPAILAAGSPAHVPAGSYSIVARISGPDGMWDYAAVDPAAKRLYLAHDDRISILDLAGGHAWTQLEVPGAARNMWHGVVPMAPRGWVLGTNGETHALTIFDAGTGQTLGAVSTSSGPKSRLSGKMAEFAVLADPDAVVIEPKSGLAAAVNGGSGEVVLVDLDKKAVVGRVQVGGKLEFAVADGDGRLYVNVQTAHAIAVIDVPTLKVVRRITLAGCTEPKGLAYDAGTGMLISGCDNGVAKFVLAKTGKSVASLKIGRGADAVVIDGPRHRAFVPSGEDAILSIFDITDPGHISLLQTLPTEVGTRLGAVDAQTGRLYLPAATLGPPISPRPWPSVVPGTFHVLVVGSTAEP